MTNKKHKHVNADAKVSVETNDSVSTQTGNEADRGCL
jgi:hypothetical protein